jgi:hypothetical protein
LVARVAAARCAVAEFSSASAETLFRVLAFQKKTPRDHRIDAPERRPLQPRKPQARTGLAAIDTPAIAYRMKNTKKANGPSSHASTKLLIQRREYAAIGFRQHMKQQDNERRPATNPFQHDHAGLPVGLRDYRRGVHLVGHSAH